MTVPTHELLAQLNTWIDEVTRPRGYLLVGAPPAVDLRPQLRPWLDELAEDGEIIVELTVSGDEGERRPEALRERLAAAIEARFPDYRDPQATHHGRLPELLLRLSKKHLAPPSRRLLLVLHNLGELRPRGPDDNPLPRLVPHVLPRGVFLLATAHAPVSEAPWLSSLGELERVDLGPELGEASVAALITAAADTQAELMALLCAAGEPLPVTALAALLDRSVEVLRDELEKLSPLLQRSAYSNTDSDTDTDTEANTGAAPLVALLPGLRAPLRLALGEGSIADAHRLLGDAQAAQGDRYGERHSLHHALASGQRERALALASDLELLQVVLSDDHGHSLSRRIADLAAAAALEVDPDRRRVFADLERALISAAPALRGDPTALLPLLWGELRDRDWTDAALHKLFDHSAPTLRRRLPRHHREGAEALLLGHSAAVIGLALSDDGRQLASASADGTCKLWSTDGGGEALTLCGHDGPVNACLFTPAGQLLTASDDGTILLWDTASGRQLLRLRGHDGGVERLALTANGALLASLGADGLLITWELPGGRELARVHAHELGGTALAISPDGRCVATGSHDKTAKLWELPGLAPLQTLSGPEYAVSGLAFNPTGNRLAASSYDNRLWIWTLPQGEVLHEIYGHGSWVTSCAFVDDDLLLSSSRDRSVRLWTIDEQAELAQAHHELRGHTKMVNHAVSDSQGRMIYSAGADHTIRRWRLPASSQTTSSQTTPSQTITEAHEGSIRACLLGPAGELYSAGSDGTLRRWDRDTGAPAGIFTGHEHAVLGVALSDDGELLASAGSDRTIKLWDTRTQLPHRTLVGHQKWVSAVALSSDGRRLVSASHDSTLRIWEVATGAELMLLNGHTGAVLCVEIAPSGRIVSGGEDGMIRVWDPADGRELMTLAGHEGAVRALSISPDGARLISAGDDGTLRLWSLRRGRERAVLRGHNGSIVGVAFVGDDHVLSAGVDRSLRLWSLSDGGCTATLYSGHPFAALAVGRSNEDTDTDTDTDTDKAGHEALVGDDAGDLWSIAIHLATT